MTDRKGYTPKTDLTSREKIKVVYFYFVRGVAQHVLADMFEVNSGRIAEVITAARQTFGEVEDE